VISGGSGLAADRMLMGAAALVEGRPGRPKLQVSCPDPGDPGRCSRSISAVPGLDRHRAPGKPRRRSLGEYAIQACPLSERHLQALL